MQLGVRQGRIEEAQVLNAFPLFILFIAQR